MIEANGVSRWFDAPNGPVHAVRDISLSIAPASRVAIQGKSGSGKTTLLHLLAGLDSPSAGAIRIGGIELSSLRGDSLARHRRRSVGMIFQAFHLIPTFSAAENVALPLLFDGVGHDERHVRARTVLEAVGLSHRTEHRPGQLSGGEQQRVSIARALVMEPRVLLADEPTGNLDEVTAREIMSLLTDISQNRSLTLVIVTHDDRLAEEFADRTVRLVEGRVAGA